MAIRESDVRKASLFLGILAALGVFRVPAQCQARPATNSQAFGASASASGTTNAPGSDSRTTKAVNYRRVGGGGTKIEFRGTELMQQASGEAKVENKGNRIEIDARFESLEDATKFGLEYLTYVLWAVSPQGRAVNLGELELKSGAARVKAITDMQTFGMVVTVEPYFAVTQPGNMVVMENALGSDTLAKIENIEARYELLARGVYSSSNTKIENAIFGIDRKTPVELFEARNAVRIARNAGAEKYAGPSLTKAAQQLASAEDLYRQKRDKKSVTAAARDSVQTAEEARVIAVKQKRLAQEEAEKASADAARAKEDADKARAAAARAESEKAELRAQLLGQLNAVLQTQDSARGLIVNMSDVLFDTGSYTLKPATREKLAKISGIVLAHPGLTLQIEGHTDSVGSDDFNQRLSQQRAGSVLDFLAEQGVPASSMSSHGYGKTQPVASNDSADGRQKNRRVELVVNGEAIGGAAASASSSR